LTVAQKSGRLRERGAHSISPPHRSLLVSARPMQVEDLEKLCS